MKETATKKHLHSSAESIHIIIPLIVNGASLTSCRVYKPGECAILRADSLLLIFFFSFLKFDRPKF